MSISPGRGGVQLCDGVIEAPARFVGVGRGEQLARAPGTPFPRDAHLRDRAAEHAAAARPGSRAATFWTSMVRAAEGDIKRSLEHDRYLEDDDE
jgi:hypothetical protein